MPVVLRILTETLIPVFFVLGFGVYAGLRGRIDNRNTAAINVLLMHFALPCSLFLGIARSSLPLLRSQLPLLAVLVFAMALTYGLQFFLSRRVFGRPVQEAAVGSLTSAFANNVAVGLPLLVSLYGSAGLTAVTFGILVGALLLSPLTLVMLERESGASTPHLQQRFLSACLSSLRRPVVLAPLAGLLFLMLGFKIPPFLGGSLDLIGKCTVGLALFLTGLLLSAQPFRLSPAVLAGVFSKSVAQPAFVLTFIILFHLRVDLGREALLLSVLPAGFFGTVFGARYGVSSAEMNSVLVLSTVLSVVTLPAAYLLGLHLP